MNKLFSNLNLDSGILNNHNFAVLYEPENEKNIQKILRINNLKLNKNEFIYSIVGCNVNIPLPFKTNIILDIDNTDFFYFEECEIKSVFILGGKLIDEIPANWNSSALINFKNGVPDFLNAPINRFCLCNADLLNQVNNQI